MFAEVYYTDGTDEYKMTFRIQYEGDEIRQGEKEYMFKGCEITRVVYSK